MSDIVLFLLPSPLFLSPLSPVSFCPSQTSLKSPDPPLSSSGIPGMRYHVALHRHLIIFFQKLTEKTEPPLFLFSNLVSGCKPAS